MRAPHFARTEAQRKRATCSSRTERQPFLMAFCARWKTHLHRLVDSARKRRASHISIAVQLQLTNICAESARCHQAAAIAENGFSETAQNTWSPRTPFIGAARMRIVRKIWSSRSWDVVPRIILPAVGLAVEIYYLIIYSIAKFR